VHGSRLDSGSAVLSLISLPDVHAKIIMPSERDLALAAGAPADPGSRRVLREHLLGLDDAVDYRVVVLLSVGDARAVELVMGLIDERWPRAAVIGGIAHSVFAWEAGQLATSRDRGCGGVVGLALSGDVPLQAIVSRGVSPRSPQLTVADYEYDEAAELLVVRSLLAPSPAAAATATGPATSGAAVSGWNDAAGQLLSPLNALYYYDVRGDVLNARASPVRSEQPSAPQRLGANRFTIHYTYQTRYRWPAVGTCMWGCRRRSSSSSRQEEQREGRRSAARRPLPS
jgi:hypothetical protein